MRNSATNNAEPARSGRHPARRRRRGQLVRHAHEHRRQRLRRAQRGRRQHRRRREPAEGREQLVGPVLARRHQPLQRRAERQHPAAEQRSGGLADQEPAATRRTRSTASPSADGSTTVDFLPYRNGPQSDPNTGQFPVVPAPIPVADAAPAVTVTAERAEYCRGRDRAADRDAERRLRHPPGDVLRRRRRTSAATDRRPTPRRSRCPTTRRAATTRWPRRPRTRSARRAHRRRRRCHRSSATTDRHARSRRRSVSCPPNVPERSGRDGETVTVEPGRPAGRRERRLLPRRTVACASTRALRTRASSSRAGHGDRARRPCASS